MKILKHCFFVGILVILILGCNGGNSLNGTWENKERGVTVIFSGKKITQKRLWMEMKGTYSISNDKIEVTSDGKTETAPFSRIDNNTITIEGMQLTRLNKKSGSTPKTGNEKRLIGTWADNEWTWVINKDGTLKVNELTFNEYAVTETQLIFRGNELWKYNYSFSSDGKKLILDLDGWPNSSGIERGVKFEPDYMLTKK